MSTVYVIVATDPEPYEESSWNVCYFLDKAKADKFATDSTLKMTKLYDKAQKEAIKTEAFWWRTKFGIEYQKALKEIFNSDERAHCKIILSVQELKHG